MFLSLVSPERPCERGCPIGHVRYINILTWLRGFQVKIVNFLSFFCLSIPKRDSNTKKTTPNIEVWPESLGAMLEYWYIERGLLVLYVLESFMSLEYRFHSFIHCAYACAYFTSVCTTTRFLCLHWTLVLIPEMWTRLYSLERADEYKPVAFLVLFAVPLCSSAHFPAILSLLGWTVRTEQEHVRYETIIQPRKPGSEIWC